MSLTILSVAYSLAPVRDDTAGGAEQILAIIDEALVRSGHNSIVIACEGSRSAGELVTVPRINGSLDYSSRNLAQKEMRKAIRRVLKSRVVDLIHMHGFDFHAYLPPAGTPALVTLHLPPSWYPREVFRLKRLRTYLNCVSATQNRACPRSEKLLPQISNGIPVEKFRMQREKEDYALVLGRICPEKGFHMALNAAIRAEIPVVVAGEVFQYEAHVQYFKKEVLPRLDGRNRRFIGSVDLSQKRSLLSNARCILIPSLAEETSSLVAMEALASGTPVIAFAAGALTEIVEPGKTGFLVNNEVEMAEAIRHVRSISPSDCRRAAEERFSSHRMTKEYLKVYRKLTKEVG